MTAVQTGATAGLVLAGAGGADVLTGGNGNDWLFGLGGNDRLVGRVGTDRMAGGTGADDFVFGTTGQSRVGTARDVISDFQPGIDDIDLASIDANTGASGNQAFRYIGAQAFARAGDLRYAGGIVAGDVNGDGRPDFEIAVTGSPTLTGADFIL
jgi:serralysin